MRFWLWLLASALTVSVTTGCGPGLDDDDDDDDNGVEYLLESGLYEETSFLIDLNECNLLLEPDDDGMEVEEDPLRVNGLPVERTGNDFLGEQSATINYTSYDCETQFDLVYTGAVTADNHFTIGIKMTQSYLSGAGCDQVAPVLPCTSKFTSDYAL